MFATKVAERVEERILDRLEHLVPPMQPMLLSVKGAAIYLGRTEQAIQHLIFTHELPVVRVGRRVHLDRRDLDAWIEKNKY
jgi:excisionase family DNA binding protein